MVEAIGSEAESRFTGKVDKVTVEVGPLPQMAPPKQAEAEQTQRRLTHLRTMAE